MGRTRWSNQKVAIIGGMVHCILQGVLVPLLIDFLASLRLKKGRWPFKLYVAFVNALVLGQTIVQLYDIVDSFDSESRVSRPAVSSVKPPPCIGSTLLYIPLLENLHATCGVRIATFGAMVHCIDSGVVAVCEARPASACLVRYNNVFKTIWQVTWVRPCLKLPLVHSISRIGIGGFTTNPCDHCSNQRLVPRRESLCSFADDHYCRPEIRRGHIRAQLEKSNARSELAPVLTRANDTPTAALAHTEKPEVQRRAHLMGLVQSVELRALKTLQSAIRIFTLHNAVQTRIRKLSRCGGGRIVYGNLMVGTTVKDLDSHSDRPALAPVAGIDGAAKPHGAVMIALAGLLGLLPLNSGAWGIYYNSEARRVGHKGPEDLSMIVGLDTHSLMVAINLVNDQGMWWASCRGASLLKFRPESPVEWGSRSSVPGYYLHHHAMSDIEKRVSRDDHETTSASVDQAPTGVVGIYKNTMTQVVMLGFVCFMGPGLFNALNGLGGGGRVDQTTSANGNAALYSTFAVGAFFAGLAPGSPCLSGQLVLAVLRTYMTMLAGSLFLLALAILGLCAGLLWTAQGSLMLAYPTVAIPMFMADPKTMYRADGSKVTAPRQPSWKTEIMGLWIALRTDPSILLLFPMFLASIPGNSTTTTVPCLTFVLVH
ncbi:hypothetical protein AG1IA_02630 [Rhizoctonia solani AG-1 IA]|uniref:Uncharacterized protein n=1 Tax=Thanatephorus cucumeris (strain AG1-IA) TaxID=983506 RepID=L8WZE6_THACA|nr:hypothetical protein AG1IA_02630 [Rhizoctonia solani AG-1 IA]